MSFFTSPPKFSIVCPHPCDNSRPSFYILDSVHIFKCIRNNWLNQKSDGKCISFPLFQFGNVATCTENDSEYAVASFDALRELHHLESDLTAKYTYRLSVKALYPSNFERQNVKFVLQVFNNFVNQALLHLGPKFYHSTLP